MSLLRYRHGSSGQTTRCKWQHVLTESGKGKRNFPKGHMTRTETKIKQHNQDKMFVSSEGRGFPWPPTWCRRQDSLWCKHKGSRSPVEGHLAGQSHASCVKWGVPGDPRGITLTHEDLWYSYVVSGSWCALILGWGHTFLRHNKTLTAGRRWHRTYLSDASSYVCAYVYVCRGEGITWKRLLILVFTLLTAVSLNWSLEIWCCVNQWCFFIYEAAFICKASCCGKLVYADLRIFYLTFFSWKPFWFYIWSLLSSLKHPV